MKTDPKNIGVITKAKTFGYDTCTQLHGAPFFIHLIPRTALPEEFMSNRRLQQGPQLSLLRAVLIHDRSQNLGLLHSQGNVGKEGIETQIPENH